MGGGGLQGFGVNGKLVNITVHHQYRSPPGYWAPEGGGGGLQGFGVNGKEVNITVHHQYRSPPKGIGPLKGGGGGYRVLV